MTLLEFVACLGFDTRADGGFSGRFSTGNIGLRQAKCVPSSESNWIIFDN